MHEHAVMAVIEGFQKKHLADQTLMGFAVIDDDEGILVASSFDQKYGDKLTNPIRRWIIYQCDARGFQAFEMKNEDDFKSYAANTLRYAAA